MDLRYALFHTALRAKAPFSRRQRQQRMDLFLRTMNLQGGERVLDLGGTAAFWRDCPLPLRLTIVNLPGSGMQDAGPSIHDMTLVEGDACAMPFVADRSFDIAFSNSVIEHVGPVARQQAFAREVRRAAPRYWVQTPSIWFPIEAHNHMPFWWFWPAPLQRSTIARWRRKLPEWTEMIEGTTVILRADLQRMFPEATLWTERFAGFPKSYVAWCKDAARNGAGRNGSARNGAAQ